MCILVGLPEMLERGGLNISVFTICIISVNVSECRRIIRATPPQSNIPSTVTSLSTQYSTLGTGEPMLGLYFSVFRNLASFFLSPSPLIVGGVNCSIKLINPGVWDILTKQGLRYKHWHVSQYSSARGIKREIATADGPK